jgi:hypothetical protein
MLLVLAAAVGVFAALGITTPVSAQECFDCVDEYLGGGEWEHWFDDTTWDPMEDVHWDRAEGECVFWHNYCPAPEAAADVPTLDRLVTLVETADSAELSRLLDAHGTVITLNASRRAVQVLNCGGQVAAHIPITNDELLQSLTAASAVATLGDDVHAPRD